jgi:hypothetical protein
MPIKKTRRKVLKNKRSRKASGYINECIIPAPFDDKERNESCKMINLHDDYGREELDKLGITDKDKQCNMYYYIHKGKYYRCRDAGKNKCNKMGRSGLLRSKCKENSVDRIEHENRALEGELRTLIQPAKSVKLSNDVRFPSVPTHDPSLANKFPHVPTHKPYSKTSISPQSNVTRKQPVTITKRASPVNKSLSSIHSKKQLTKSIQNLQAQNDKYAKQMEKLRERLKTNRTRGNVTRQMERMVSRQHKMFDIQIKRNEVTIDNLHRLSRI